MLKLQDGILDALAGEFEATARRERFFNDPEGWINYMLDEELWSRQREVANSILSNKNTAVKAGHGIGKSFLASRLICWWVDTRAPDVFVASTAPSKAQVSQIIWDSIRSCYNKIEQRYNTNVIDHKLPGVILGDDTWKINGEIVGSGRKPPDGKVEDSFQGIHRRYVLAIGDESSGLGVGLIDSLGNITTNEGSRRLLIGNPTNPARAVQLSNPSRDRNSLRIRSSNTARTPLGTRLVSLVSSLTTSRTPSLRPTTSRRRQPWSLMCQKVLGRFSVWTSAVMARTEQSCT